MIYKPKVSKDKIFNYKKFKNFFYNIFYYWDIFNYIQIIILFLNIGNIELIDNVK